MREKWPVFRMRFYCDRSVLTSAHLTNGAVSTQYLLYLPRLGPDFVIFIVPRPGGHQAGLGWAGLAGWAGWAGIIWTKKLKYARIYILQQPGPARPAHGRWVAVTRTIHEMGQRSSVTFSRYQRTSEDLLF